MPLVGYLKTKEPGRISSITNLDGDLERRKKIRQIPNQMKEPSISMYVLDCYTHEPGGSVVPVILKELTPGRGWQEIGVAKCCPLCWRIIQPPVGVDLPVAIDQPVLSASITDTGTITISQLKRKAPRKPILDGFEVQKNILAYLKPIGEADVYEIMGLLGCSRQTALKHLSRLIKQKKVIKSVEGGGGGHRSMYSLP